MHPFSTVLLGAAALPALAHAASYPDPADAGASVAAVGPAPAFSDYRPFRDDTPADWRGLNRLVRPAPLPRTTPRDAKRAPSAPSHQHEHLHAGRPIANEEAPK
jgi:hypothetical protein